MATPQISVKEQIVRDFWMRNTDVLQKMSVDSDGKDMIFTLIATKGQSKKIQELKNSLGDDVIVKVEYK